MIDGAEHFHYLGLARRNRSVMMVFQEGVLILDQDLPGWGVMRPSDLHPSPAHSGSSSQSTEEMDSDDIAFSDSLSHDTLQTSTSRSSNSGSNSGSNSPSLSPRASGSASPSASSHEDDAPPAWSPPHVMLGWHPAESVVHVGPVTNKAVETYRSLSTPHDVQNFVAQLKDGHWAPQPVGSPGHGTMVAQQSFGALHLMIWNGTWHAAGSAEHQQNGLSAEQACHIVARSVVANVCNLAPVMNAELSEYHGQFENGPASILVFDRGMLVQKHPDPRMVGWHGFGTHGRWAIVSPGGADALEMLCNRNTPKEHEAFEAFFLADLDDPAGSGPFVAVVLSHKLNRPVCLRLNNPGGMRRAGDPHGPTQAAVDQALRQAHPALVHNMHDVKGPHGLHSGSWQIPLLLGAIQCIDASVDVPGLVGTTWHDTLQPVVERQLLAHHPQEAAWLASGVIKQPIDRLIDLTRRDVALRRDEVWVMWPVDLLDDLLKTLAPHDKTRVIHAPKAADVDLALGQKACTLFVFQVAGQPDQSVALAQGNRCWSGSEHFSLKDLKARVTRSLSSGPGERLVALAYVV